MSVSATAPAADTRPRYFHVYCLDAPGSAPLRAEHAAAHREYISTHKDKLYVGGPLLADGDDTRVGAFMILKMTSREEVNAFLADEPYNRAGVFETVSIRKMTCAVQP